VRDFSEENQQRQESASRPISPDCRDSTVTIESGRYRDPFKLFAPFLDPKRLTPIELTDGAENHIRNAGDNRDSAFAVRGLHGRHDAGSAEHAVLRFDALRPIESKPRLLQDDGLFAVTECSTPGSCQFASAGYVRS